MKFWTRKLAAAGQGLGLAAVLILGCADQTRAQARTPDPAVAEGIALHDKGEFDKAIEKYKEALDRDPQNIDALYEMMYTLYAKRDFKAALAIAEKGAKEKGRLRPAFLMMIGNAQDDLGNAPAAVKAYESAIKEAPNDSLLHFNLGVTSLGQKEWKKARLSFQRDISLNPAHASGHFRLAQVYEQEGFKIPALLAYLRFLTLEPSSSRSKGVVAAVDRLWSAGYSKGEKGNVNIQVTFGPDSGRKEEGDFGPAELMMQIGKAAADIVVKPGEEAPPVTPEPMATMKALSSAITSIVEASGGAGSGFAATYYLPYFAALSKQKDLEEAACYFVWQSKGMDGVNPWLAENQEVVSRFMTWSNEFAWSRPKN